MKKNTLFISALFCSCCLFSQNIIDDGKVEILYPSKFQVTKPLSELAAENSLSIAVEKKESNDKKFRIPYLPKDNPNALPQGDDPACQKTAGTKLLQAPLVNWTGQPGQYYPPDPTGAAGIDNYVQAVNSEYAIYTKTGSIAPGGGPFSLGSLLFGSNEGDPIVMYDKFADRWVITEFGTTNVFYIGVSATSDATGSYYTYQFNSPDFPDYLKFSIWTDGYYMTSNQNSPRVFAFERDQMLLGNSGARSINKTFTVANDGSFFCPLTASADGELPPAGTPCPIFSYEDDGWGGTYVDRINIFNMNVVWGATPTATVTLAAQLPTQSFDASYDYNWDDVSQPGTTDKLDGIGGVFTFRAPYMVWTGYNSVVLNCGVLVNASTGQRAIRWYELRQDASSGVWSIYQQSTYSPDGLNRWVGSIAMDINGSIAMAYAVSGVDGANSVFPSIRYTGRLATDPLDQMTFAEEIAAAGNSAQTGINRFGDYSHTCLDPADGTIFWHTGEYIWNNEPATKIFSFRIPLSTDISDLQDQTSITVYNADGKIYVKSANLPSNDKMVVDLFDIAGKKIYGLNVVPESESFETSFDASGLSKGTYLVRVGMTNTSFQKVTKVIIN